MEEQPILQIKGLTKKYGYFPVLRGVDLEIRRGELTLLLGPNGAGKTTLTRILCTLARPGSGTVLFDGRPLKEKVRKELRSRIGFLSHQTFLYGHLSARENLSFFGSLYGVDNLQDRVERLLDEVGLTRTGRRQVETFYRGMQQRLALARVLLADPSLLILDEPYTGLDPEGSATLTRVLGDLKEAGRALLLVTHDIEACLGIADRLAVLVKGRIRWETETAGLDLESVRRGYHQAVASAAKRGKP